MADFYEVRFTVRLPAEATEAEAEAWLRYCLHDTNTMRGDNPLCCYDPEPVRGTFRMFPTAGTRGVAPSEPTHCHACGCDVLPGQDCRRKRGANPPPDCVAAGVEGKS